jgi:hypothetical protein
MMPSFIFDRYVNGTLMAEGVTIEREPDLQSATKVAARLASKGPNGEVPVLVYVPKPTMQDDLTPEAVEGLACEAELFGYKKQAAALRALSARLAEVEAENEDLKYPTWPQWASEILATLKEFGWRFDDDTVDLPGAVSDWLREYPDSATDGLIEQRDDAINRAEAAELRARESALDALAAYGQAAEAHTAQLAAEAEIAAASANALRDAAAKCEAARLHRVNQLDTIEAKQDQRDRWIAGRMQAEILRDQILALIPQQEKPHE